MVNTMYMYMHTLPNWESTAEAACLTDEKSDLAMYSSCGITDLAFEKKKGQS